MRRFKDSPVESVSLSLNSEVVEVAQELGLDLSKIVDQLLTAEVTRRYWEAWAIKNKQGIADYNERVAKDGLPLARYRKF